MHRILIRARILLVFVLLILSACAPAATPTPKSEPTLTRPPTSAPTPTPTPTPTPVVTLAEVKILNGSLFFTPSGMLGGQWNLQGEIQNTGTTWVTDVKLKATFYDDRGYLLKEETGRAELQYLAPGQKSPFTLYEFPPDTKYELEVSPESTSPKQAYKGIEIIGTEFKIFYETSKYLNIEIHNAGDKTVSGLLLATFYDQEGRVLSYDEGGFNDLLPNQARSTSISAPFEFSTYSLQVICYQ